MVGLMCLSLATGRLLPTTEGPPWKHRPCIQGRIWGNGRGPSSVARPQAGPQRPCVQTPALHPRCHWPCWVEMSFEKPLLGLLKEAIDLMADYFLEMTHWTGFPFSLFKESRDKHNSRIVISKSFTLPHTKIFTAALKSLSTEDSRKTRSILKSSNILISKDM